MKLESSQPVEEKQRGVKSASRVLDVLEYFARTTTPASLARLCVELDMPKSSCHALMETLRHQGYIYWLGKEQGYYPTRRWRDLGEAITQHDPILSLVSDILRGISEQTGETAIIAKREERDVLYLDVVEPDRTLRFTASTGQIKPMHSAASGRALLSLESVAERRRLLAGAPLQSYSTHTVTELDAVLDMITAGESLGYHVAVGEYQAHTTAIAASFRFGTEGYALVVGGPTARLDSGRIEEIGQLLIARAKDIAAMR